MNIENDTVGFLTVIVRTANGALPVENAQVTIYDYSNGDNVANNSDIIYTLTTDNSGRTQKVVLSTKSKDTSLAPKNQVPFKGYSINVVKEGFYDSSYINVPIYQGVSSLQFANLIPLSEYSSPTDAIPNDGRVYVEESNN